MHKHENDVRPAFKTHKDINITDMNKQKIHLSLYVKKKVETEAKM